MESENPIFEVNKSLYPFRSKWFKKDGARMHYIDEGRGMPVLLLHGNPTWSFLYRKIISKIKDDFRCIAPDYPGFGLSEIPEGYGLSPRDHLEWVRGLVEELNLDKFLIVTHDWGGPIGLNLAVTHPDAVVGIVICNTWCFSPDIILRLFSFLAGGILFKFLQLRFNFFVKNIFSPGIYRDNERISEILREYQKPFKDRERRRGPWIFPREIHNSQKWILETAGKLKLLRGKPVKIILGEKDFIFGRDYYQYKWNTYLPDAEITVVKNSGHYMQEDRPDAIIDSIYSLNIR